MERRVRRPVRIRWQGDPFIGDPGATTESGELEFAWRRIGLLRAAFRAEPRRLLAALWSVERELSP